MTALRISLICAVTATAAFAADIPSVDEQVKGQAQRYNEIEAQLDRSVRYSRKTTDGGITRTEQAWFNGADDLIKIAVEMRDASTRELTEYIALDFDNNYDGMFVLNRKETSLPDGGTQVDESRKYFGYMLFKDADGNQTGNGVLIRELRKSAKFKAGETLDTVHTKNVVVDPAALRAQNNDEKGREEIMRAPEKIAEELRKSGPPEFDPYANVKGDEEKYRVIHGTASPDGRFAIGLGFHRDYMDESDWDSLIQEQGDMSHTYYAEDEPDIRNYVVDLAHKKILGETGCHYFGTRRRYNHREIYVTWSPDCSAFVELWANKWSSDGCVAGKVRAGPKVSSVDMIEELSEKTYAFMKKRFNHEEGGSLTFSINKVTNDGVIDLDASEVDPSVPHRGETIFAVNERVRLRDGPKRAGLEILSMRRLKVEQSD
jgi:hypothetical protein